MHILSRKNRKKEQHIFHGGILLEEQVRHAGRNNLPLKIFKFQDLSRATNGFTTQLYSDTYLGDYYKATIDGVQVLINQNGWEWRQQKYLFFNEITILSSIRHRNVIKLLGCCLDAPVPLIVFEFIPNGNLEVLIRSRVVDRLPWPDRLRIATGISEALAYLHHYGQRPIIHQRVDPHYVFLDDDYNPKLGGFAAAILKLKDEEEANSSNSRGIRITEKDDVYSFGELLFVLFFWQLSSFQVLRLDEEQLALTTFMSVLEFLGLDLKKDDPFILEKAIKRFQIANAAEIILEEVSARREQLGAFAGLGLRCLNRREEFRPTMKDVVIELKRIQKMELQDHEV